MSARYRRLVLCVVCASVVLGAQSPPLAQDPPAFRTGISFIEVDVVVTDGSGFVRDLSREDFEIFDDGERQEVLSFALVDLPAPSEPGRQASIDDLTRTYTDDVVPEGRVYALLLDSPIPWSDASGPVPIPSPHLRYLKDLAHRFVDEAFGSDDLMSVSFVRHLRLHRDELLLRQPPRGAMPVQGLTKSRPLLRSAIERFHERNLRSELVLTPRNTVTPLPWSYLALRETAEALGRVTGRRKAILWIGGHVPFHHDAQPEVAFAYRDAVRAAARHNVAVYPIDPRRLGSDVGGRTPVTVGSPGPLGPWRDSDLVRLAALRAVAEDTGGIAVVNTNDMDAGFERIVRDTSSYYLLGYSPAVEYDDGRFREIEVRVARRGVSVRARRGYFASEAVPPAPPAPAVLSAAAQAVAGLGDPTRRDALHLRTSAVTAGSAGDPRALWIVGEIDSATRRERRWAGGTAAVAVISNDGSTAFTNEIELPAADSAFAMRVPETVDLRPGEYTLRIRLSAAGAEPLSETRRFSVPEDESPLGQAMLWRRGPATARRDVPTADPRVRRTEQLRLELPTRSDAPATARLLDRTGAPLPAPLPMTEHRQDGLRWIVVQVPVSAFAPGDYVVEVLQEGRVELTAFRVVP